MLSLTINLLHIGGLLPTKVTLIWYNDFDFLFCFVTVTSMLKLIDNAKVQQPRLFAVCWNLLCTPGMGVNLWGESPLYMNRVPSFYDGSESTNRRQGHHREVVWGGEEKNLPLPD